VSDPSNASGSHYAVLDGWRGISILLVLLGHLFPLGPKVLEMNLAIATMGMAIFFTLSGFLITSLLLRNAGVGNFLLRRFFRIVPLAWLACGIALLLQHPGEARVWLAHFAFYGNLPPFLLLPVTAHIWSLCLEMQFYVGIALLVAAFGSRRLVVLPVIAVSVTLLRISAHETVSIVTWFRIDEILAGCTLALVLHRFPRSATATVLSRVPPIVWLLLLFAACHPSGGPALYLRPYFAAAMVGATLFQPAGGFARALDNRALAYLALVSFALYVLHPLLADTWLGSGDRWERYAKRPLLLAALFALAHLSTTQFESRWIAWGRVLAERWTAHRHRTSTE
jgi:peptidoglycan/LPS O-acetylase OafA/YrhL